MTDSDRKGFLQALDSAATSGFNNRLRNTTDSLRNATNNASLFSLNSSSTGLLSSTAWSASALSTPGASLSNVFNNASLSRNNSAITEYDVNEEYRYWVLVMLLVPALTIFGNVLVVLAVFRERSLQSVTNYFIVSLAFADILVAAIVMPVSVIVEVRNGHWDFSDLQCDLWIMCDALFSTASILNLVAISIDRFIAVTQPIKYAKHRNSKRTHVTIAVTWLLSIGIALPIGCGLQNLQGLRYHEKFRHVCTFFNGDFLIYSSLGSFYIPCLVMLVLYYRIFTVIRGRAKKVVNAKKLRALPSQQQREQQKQKQQKSVERPQTLLSASSKAKPELLGDAKCSACQADGIYIGEEAARHTCRLQSIRTGGSSVDSPQQCTDTVPSNSYNNSAAHSDSGGKRPSNQQQKKQQLFKQLKLRKKSTSSKAERSAAKREKKATKTLAIVLGVFLFCWLPFFITNLMWAACLKNFDNQDSLGVICQYDRRINVFIVWLGYVNSFLNPLIYTIFNTEFRKAFKKLLHIR